MGEDYKSSGNLEVQFMRAPEEGKMVFSSTCVLENNVKDNRIVKIRKSVLFTAIKTDTLL
jgi:hypothetical protein